MQLLKPFLHFRRFWISSSELLRNQKHQVGVLLKTLPLMLLLSGCVSVSLNNSERLMQHPEFEAAAQAAPAFTTEALKTINRLEYELERK